MTPGDHGGLLEGLGIADALARRRLGAYLEALDTWADRTNLTGSGRGIERARLLVGDVVEAAAWVQGPRMLDIGSGNGSPGLVLAALRPEVEVVLLEPRLRRWAFLREAARRMERDGIEVARCRAEEFEQGGFATVALRAVRVSPSTLLARLGPHGRAITWTPGLDLGPEGFRSLHQGDRHLQVWERCFT